MVDRFPKWWLIYVVARGLFLRFGVITLIIFTPLFTYFVFESPYTVKVDGYLIVFVCWFLLIVPFLVNYVIAKSRKAQITQVLDVIKSTGYFKPNRDSEAWLFWKNTYIGFDYHQGTIVYIRIYPGKVMDVLGFDAYGIVRTEVEGSQLRIFTKYASLPMIPVETGAASTISNHIFAMNNKGYNYTFDFQNVIKSKRGELQHLAGMPIPELI